jgi:hypothetical protein
MDANYMDKFLYEIGKYIHSRLIFEKKKARMMLDFHGKAQLDNNKEI